MPGHLKTNPFLKTYDEAQRSHKRMLTFLETNGFALSKDLQDSVKKIVEALDTVINEIPEEFRVTKHYYTRKK
jgi:prophage maintenance system killer protein